jgi:hypothetical protein
MTGTNHALAGGLLAKYLPLPLALPLALVSHFFLDALPHYGLPNKKRNKSTFWKVFFVCDFIVAFSFAVLQISFHHYAIFLGGLVALVPDFVWVSRVAKSKSFDLSHNQHWFTTWHARIQRYERPWGLWVETPLAIVLFYFVFLTPY